ncbi:unnamed protein product [Caenorhabditis bovis]|uniref:Uncharacterized protein n=1 Tax=Caenorhabditis bovis TaxID=2654633 RepID=A0A8S1EUJ1_9PELO|nr:unnamed protein product [Caenorhabditis bovis]
MERAYSPSRDQMRRCIDATENAIELIQHGDLTRRKVAIELRDLQLTMHEDFERLKDEMTEFESQVHKERIESAKWMNEKLSAARNAANQAIKSTILLKDIQILEKKVDILKESVINVNKAYYNYQKNVDVKDLMDQVREMVYRTEKKEKELASQFDGETGIRKNILRGAVEGLLGLRSTNPALIEEARQIAYELRVFRDAAMNNNLMAMIGKSESCKSSSSMDSSDGRETAFTGFSSISERKATPDATSSTGWADQNSSMRLRIPASTSTASTTTSSIVTI